MSKNCLALSITTDETSNKVHIKTANIDKTLNIQEIKTEESKEYLYNITFENIDPIYGYDDYEFYGDINPLNKELKNEIALITYFGYGYQNRTDKKWYVITQYLIWQEITKSENGIIYFEDENNNKLNVYEKEIQSIKEDIKKYKNIPSFLEPGALKESYYLNLTEELVLEDANKVLQEFKIIENSNSINYKIENNKVTITPIIPNNINVFFQKKFEESEDMKIYINSTPQKLIKRGQINELTINLTLIIRCPKVELKSLSANKFPINNTEYKVYSADNNQELFHIKINKNGLSDKMELYPGKYFLEQTKASYGYKLNKEKIYFEIKKEDITLNIENELDTKHVTIEHQLIKENNDIVTNSHSKLSIYDENNKLTKEITTDDNGKAYIELSYGTYKIIKNNQIRNIEELANFKIDENFNENKSIIIKEEINNNQNSTENNEITSKGSIIINKIDYATGKALSGLKYALYNKDKELIKEDTTDLNGKIIFKDLVTGTYYIKEILNDKDYELEDGIKIEVKENIDTIITANNRTETNVPNTLSKSSNIIIIILIFIGVINLPDVKIFQKEKTFN